LTEDFTEIANHKDIQPSHRKEKERQQERNNILHIEEKQELLTIEKEMEVFVESENEDISKKIYQKLMEAKTNNFNLIK
jgi:hypothetical protein